MTKRSPLHMGAGVLDPLYRPATNYACTHNMAANMLYLCIVLVAVYGHISRHVVAFFQEFLGSDYPLLYDSK